MLRQSGSYHTIIEEKTAIDSPKCQGEAERLREQLLSLGLQDHKTSWSYVVKTHYRHEFILEGSLAIESLHIIATTQDLSLGCWSFHLLFPGLCIGRDGRTLPLSVHVEHCTVAKSEGVGGRGEGGDAGRWGGARCHDDGLTLHADWRKILPGGRVGGCTRGMLVSLVVVLCLWQYRISTGM